MMYHLVSTDPSNYGTVKFRGSIGSMNSVVMYRINSLSTIAGVSLITDDDYLKIETTINNQPIEVMIHFQEHGGYNMRTLAKEIDELVDGQLVPVVEDAFKIDIAMDSTNRLLITANEDFTITDASHHVKLLLGLYHSTLPIQSTAKTIRCPSVPLTSYGNVLYLTARTDFISTLNLEDKEITRSIAYKTNEVIHPGYPINCKLPGNWSIIHSDQLSSLEFQLVDFQLEPVILHAPLFITLEIERLDNINQYERMNWLDVL